MNSALAAGVPVATFAGNGVPGELVAQSPSGQLAVFGNVASLSARILHVLDHVVGHLPKPRRSSGNATAGRDEASRFFAMLSLRFERLV